MQDFIDNTGIIGNNLIALRLFGNLSKMDFARLFRTSARNISRWESGTGSIPERIIALASTIAMCSLEEFISVKQTTRNISNRHNVAEIKISQAITRKRQEKKTLQSE